MTTTLQIADRAGLDSVVERVVAALAVVEKAVVEFGQDTQNYRDERHAEQWDKRRMPIIEPMTSAQNRAAILSTKIAADERKVIEDVLKSGDPDRAIRAARHSEVRSALRAMGRDKAAAAVWRAFGAGDEEVIAAIISAPSFSLDEVGLDEGFKASVRAKLIAQRVGDDSEAARERHFTERIAASLSRVFEAGAERPLVMAGR